MPTFATIAASAAVTSSTIATTIFNALASFVISRVVSAVLQPKQKAQSPGGGVQSQGRMVSVRQAVSPWQIVYGEARIGGIVTFLQPSSDQQTLYMVITLAGTEVEAIGDSYFNDELIPLSGSDAIGKYAGYATIEKALGDEVGQPFPHLAAISGDANWWGATDLQQGRAKIYTKLTANHDLFTSGIPNISAVVRGRKVYDPRSDSEIWTANVALCVADYLTNADFGLGADYDLEIDEDDLIAAANICDERVLLAGDITTFTAGPSEETISLPDEARLPMTGDGVRVSTAGTLPGPLVAGTTYYIIRADATDNFDHPIRRCKLAASYDDALAGTAIDLTSAGSGELVLTYYDEPRYSANGAFKVDATPQSVLELLLAAMAGRALNVGGRWHIFAGAYEAPTLTFDETDLAGAIKIQPLISRRDNCNGVKGKFTNPDAHWQPDDFPALASATYMAEDGGQRVWKDIDVSAFVTKSSQAQRLAKIELLRTRQALTAVMPCKLTAWEAMTGRTIAQDNTKLGWSGKAFEVLSSRFTFDQELGVELSLQETAPAVYDWSTSEERAMDLAANSELPDPTAALDLTGLTASSGTADLFMNGDGTVVPRVRLRWTEPGNPFIDHYDVQSARTDRSPSEWVDSPPVRAPASEGFAINVEDGIAYDLRVRAVTVLGNRGDFSYVLGHSVIGKTELPSDVTGASAVQSGGLVVMSCDSVEDADLDAVEIRLQDAGSSDFDNGAPVANILRGQTITSAAIPPGTWELLFKARDTSGNYSANAAQVTLVVTAEGFTTISANPQAVQWLGSLTHMVKHWTGVLTPESQSPASALGWEVFDEFVPNAEPDCYYEAPVIDKAIDATARIYGDIVSTLGPGETTGIANPGLEVDTRTSLGSFDGFLTWTVGSANFRYLKARIHIDTTVGKPVISQFTPTIDAESRDETGTYTTGGGGSVAVTFATPFHVTPVGTVSPQGSGDVTASYASLATTGFTGYFKSGGAAAAGTASYRFTGA